MAEALTLNMVKTYLRVDGDEEDELIKLLMNAAAEQIKAGVGEYDASDPRAQMILLYLVQYNYDNRNVVADAAKDNALEHLPLMYHALMFQLQTEKLPDPEGE